MITELNHFLLVAKNLERTKDFYCRVLGMEVAKERPDFGFPGYWLKTNGHICVHLASQGHPIVGDDKYGDFELNKSLHKQGLKRMYLHAWRLQFDHPASGERIELLAALPPELKKFADHAHSSPPV